GGGCARGGRELGALADLGRAVTQLVGERGGFDLLAESGYNPDNKYLPPRPRRDGASPRTGERLEPASGSAGSVSDKLFAWVDRGLSGWTAAAQGSRGPPAVA